MKFTVQREAILRPLQSLMGVVEKKHTMAVLANVLLEIGSGVLRMTATDLEIELVVNVDVSGDAVAGGVTVPGRKLMDICRSLPDGCELKFIFDKGRVVVSSGKSRFVLSNLPAQDFPSIEADIGKAGFSLLKPVLLGLLKKTYFSMAQQDARYFLNGMLFCLQPGKLLLVATDGHRLALSSTSLAGSDVNAQVIVPRKAVLELMKLVSDDDSAIEVKLGENHIRFSFDGVVFTSKLLDGSYPDYKRVLPDEAGNKFVADASGLQQALSRAAILSNEKYRGVRVILDKDNLKLVANNPEQEEAQDELSVEYDGADLEVGFNVSYLLDILSAISAEQVQLSIRDANSSARISDPSDPESVYVVMPIRL